MPVRRALLTLILIAASLPAGAAAPEAPTGPSLVVALGLGGFAPPDRPSELAVTITTPVLLTGRLRVRGADMAVSRPVEVPAGSEQTYRLTVPPLGDGARLTVEVVDMDGEAVVREAVTMRSRSSEEMAVGVVGSDDLVGLLGRVRTIVTDRPVTAFPVPPDVTPSDLDVLDYLVVSRQEGVDAALAWAAGGGSAVIDSSLVVDIGEVRPTGVPGVTRGEVGGGAVLAVDDLVGRNTDDWSAILRPAPLHLSASLDGMMGDPRSLLQAASEAGNRQVPSIPWLLIAIIGFAVVVGPVNFLVLGRLGKRDWAWVTIPVLAVMAVGAFWLAGRQRIAGTNLTHATFITDDGTVEARSAVLVAAGVAGERQLSFPAAAQVYPERSLMGSGGPELRMMDDRTVEVDLDQLAFTGIGLHTTDPGVDLPSASLDGDRLIVDNDSNLTFWGWGATAGGSSSLAGAALERGTTGQVGIPRAAGPEFGMGFVDALINRRGLWEDPARSNSLWPLSQLLFAATEQNAVYFVGLTDDYQPAVSSPGISGPIPGPTLVVVKAASLPSKDNAGATVVDTGFVNWLDWGMEQVISTDELTVRFRLPDPSLTASLTDDRRFGGAPVEYQAWDWSEGEFTSIQLGEPLPTSAVAADGEVYVRLVGANEFGDNPMSPRDLSLEWEA